MAFTKINWKPGPKEMRLWASLLLVVLGGIGSLFYFEPIEFFADKKPVAYFLWGFAALSFVTGITGTKLGMPCYLVWMSFVFVISSILGYGSLVLIFFLVVFPIGLIGRLLGRDRLGLKMGTDDTYWQPCKNTSREASSLERQF